METEGKKCVHHFRNELNAGIFPPCTGRDPKAKSSCSSIGKAAQRQQVPWEFLLHLSRAQSSSLLLLPRDPAARSSPEGLRGFRNPWEHLHKRGGPRPSFLSPNSKPDRDLLKTSKTPHHSKISSHWMSQEPLHRDVKLL